ncbi:MAG: TonB family protein [Proteobacteria bacterium]|nr:TonB family protein [Pseudomonadota bacterium]
MQFLATLIEPLGWTLLHFVWQGLLVGLLHEVALLFTARRSPQVRYAISLAALLLLLFMPLTTFALLAFETGGDAAVSTLAVATQETLRATFAPGVAAETTVASALESILPYIVILWLVGVTALSVRFGIGLYSLRRLAAHADFDAISDWMLGELERLRQRMAISRPVRIALSTRVNSPLVVGWLKPVIFLPLSAATGLDHGQIRMVLAHELAHLSRHDHFVNFLQVIVETMLFYHPAVHRISRSLRQEREQCCDDMAASISGNALAYARVLAQLEEMRQKERTHVLALGIAEQELYFRIQRLVGTPSRSSPDRWFPLMLIGLLATFALTRTPDLSAPLLPSFSDSTPQRERIVLALPESSSRPFRPITDASVTRSETVATSVDAQLEPREKAASRDVESRRSPRVAASAEVAAQRTSEPTVIDSEPTRAPATAIRSPVQASAANGTAATETSSMQATETAPPVTSGGELIHAEKPVYPRRALRQGEEGYVLLEFTITPDGRVIDPAVTKASPRGRFEAAALHAIRRWEYQPFSENGKPVARRASQVLEFRLAAPGPGSPVGECKEQTGSRLCRTVQSNDTELRVVRD